jgi:sulfatase modifying factor 1
LLLVAAATAVSAPVPARADESIPGFFVGSERPPDAAGAIRVEGGWMVPYDETLPGTDVTFRMMPVPGGVARIGSPPDEAGRDAHEGPAFEVRIEPFWMGRCEVTWSEYKRYMAACDLFKAMEAAGVRPVTPENEADAVTAPSNLYDPTMTFTNGEDPLQPAVTMTQFAARQYTKWLSGLTGRFYRLPTECEWEHACRGGSTTPWHCGSESDLGRVAWFAETSDETTHPVGELEPNAYGLHDMHGNAAEWVIDQLAADGYARQAGLPQPAPAATCIEWPTELEPRVVRGGAYYDEAGQCRSAARRGSEDVAWKDVDPNLPKSPWWYTEEPALGVGMRLVRPLVPPADLVARRRFWEADIESIRADASDRLLQGRGARGIVDPKLPEALEAAGL